MSGAATEIPQSTDAGVGGADRSAATRPWLTVSGMVRGDDVTLRNAVVGAVAGERVDFKRGVLRTAFSTQEIKIHQGAAQLVLAGGDASVVQGGAQAIVSNGSVRLEKAGAGIILARNVDLAHQSTVVFGITRHLEVKDGGRVIFGPRAALLTAGALATLMAGMTVWLRMHRT